MVTVVNLDLITTMCSLDRLGGVRNGDGLILK
jgi:hypothetical protein